MPTVDFSTTSVNQNQPSISISKLAEYMTASAIRRRQIISSMRSDSDFRKVRYSEVRKIFEPYFLSGYDASIISRAIAKIRKSTPTTDWDTNDRDNSLLALEAMNTTALPNLSKYSFIDDMGIKSIHLSGVTVYIKPDIYLQHNATMRVGAIKIHIAKTEENRLHGENRKYAATLLKFAFMENGARESDIDINACISYDVFLGEYSCATKSFKKQIRSLTAACEEIALRWDSI